ncbi:MAG: hypothetical protein HXS53_09095 [Theionarchaea archaeon]|nr:hypothetical protein [Theionarchaea archaeon]
MGEKIITTYQKILLELLSEKGRGLTREEIRQYNTERKLGIPAGELDTILESLEFRNFLRTENGDKKKWHITIQGMAAVGTKGPCWP